MSRIVRFGLSGLILLCAPLLFLQGQANTGNLSSPAFAWNGFTLADVAVGSLSMSQGPGGLSLEVSDAGQQLARQAFASEPLASDALFVFALAERTKGNGARMQAILDRAEALDKRNRNVGALQLEQAALTGELQQTFSIIDRLASVHPSLTSQFVQPLVAAMDDEASLPVLRSALEDEAVWAEGFWRAVPRDELRVRRMYALRQQVSYGTSEESDAALLAGLVGMNQFSEAFSFWEQVAGEQSGPYGFVNDTSYPPFGWQLTTTGERAMTPRGESSYDLYVQNETSGEIARQLLRLEAGSYSFSASVTPVSETENIAARLECAATDEVVGETLYLTEGASWTVSANCEAYWLVLVGSAWDRRGPLRVTISDMQFQAGS